MRFITFGCVRGCGRADGHVVMHKTIKAARAACDRDRKRCAKTGGYSDRRVYAVNVNAGERWEDVVDAVAYGEGREAF